MIPALHIVVCWLDIPLLKFITLGRESVRQCRRVCVRRAYILWILFKLHFLIVERKGENLERKRAEMGTLVVRSYQVPT